MPWFDKTPTTLPITARSMFKPAGEALEEAQRRDASHADDDGDAGQERATQDWAATGLLLLARLQLDQMLEILVGALHMSLEDGEAAALRELAERVESAALPPPDDGAFELSCVEEGLELWHALNPGNLEVTHGFAVDGSIAMTIGPTIPRLPALGLRGSTAEELNDEPDAIFDRAVACTEAAAFLATHIGAPREPK
jgi:hypothetical protein